MSERVFALMSASLEAHKGLQEDAGSLEDLTPAFENVELCEYDVTSVESVYHSLSKIADGIQTSLESNTLTPSTLDMAEIAVEGNATHLGVSVESLATFDGVGNAAVTLESIGDTLKKIWDTIKTVVARAIKAVRDFFSKLFNGVSKLQKYFEGLQKTVKDLKEDPTGNVTLTTASYLSRNSNVSSDDIIEGLKEQAVVGEFLFDSWLKSATSFYEAVARVNVDNKFTNLSLDGIPDDIDDEKAFEHAVGGMIDYKRSSDSAIQKLKRSRLLGDFTAEMDQKDVLHGTFRMTVMNFKRRDEHQKLNRSVEIPVPSRDEMSQMIERSLTVLDVISKEKSAIEDLSKAREKVSKSFDKFVQEGEKGKLGKFWTTRRANLYLRAGNASWGNPVQQYCNYSYSSLRAVGNLLEKSLKA